jgi:hypothetical protein
MSDDDDKHPGKKEAGKLGGLRRAEALTDERKAEIAQKAALARWGAKATHRGNFQEEFGIDVDCYVLDDPGKTAVISQRGMGAALGMGASGGSRLPRLVNSKVMANYVGPELREKLEKPLVFQAFTGGPNPPPSKVHGYDVTILIDVCKAVVSAEADGKKLNPAIAKQAHIIIGASAKAGIKGLVYALAGYDPTRQEVIEAFRYYVREEAREYEKEFPDLLYQEWYRLYELPRLPAQQRPYKFKHLTVDHVWKPLARSSGKIYELTKEQRVNSGGRWRKLHQFLSEVGVKALRTHLGQVLGIARISTSREQYEAHIKQLFDVQPDLPFPPVR